MGIPRSSSGAVQPVGETTAEADAAMRAQDSGQQIEAEQRQCADIMEQVKP
jgi:hypothetical protein